MDLQKDHHPTASVASADFESLVPPKQHILGNFSTSQSGDGAFLWLSGNRPDDFKSQSVMPKVRRRVIGKYLKRGTSKSFRGEETSLPSNWMVSKQFPGAQIPVQQTSGVNQVSASRGNETLPETVEYPVSVSGANVDTAKTLRPTDQFLQWGSTESSQTDQHTSRTVVKSGKLLPVSATILAKIRSLSDSVSDPPNIGESDEETTEDHTLSMTDGQYSSFDTEFVYQPSASDESNISSSSPTSSISWSSASESLFGFTGLVISTKTKIIDDLIREIYYTIQDFAHGPVSAVIDGSSEDKSSSTTTQASSSRNKGKSSSKRAVEDEQPSDDGGGEESNKRHATEQTTGSGEEKRRLRLACPYFKQNPRGQKYIACRYPGFTGIHRMK
jgi:hypothetical protein